MVGMLGVLPVVLDMLIQSVKEDVSRGYTPSPAANPRYAYALK